MPRPMCCSGAKRSAKAKRQMCKLAASDEEEGRRKDVAKCQIYFGLENENLLRSFGKIKMKFSLGPIEM